MSRTILGIGNMGASPRTGWVALASGLPEAWNEDGGPNSKLLGFASNLSTAMIRLWSRSRDVYCSGVRGFGQDNKPGLGFGRQEGFNCPRCIAPNNRISLGMCAALAIQAGVPIWSEAGSIVEQHSNDASFDQTNFTKNSYKPGLLSLRLACMPKFAKINEMGSRIEKVHNKFR
jgi:hypothetical protein